MKINKRKIKPVKVWAWLIHDGDGKNGFLGHWAFPCKKAEKKPSICYTAIQCEMRPVIRKSRRK